MTSKLEHYTGASRFSISLMSKTKFSERWNESRTEIRWLSDYRPDRSDDHVDINTGAFVGHRNLDDTIFKPILKRRRLSLASYGCVIWADYHY